MKRIGILHLSDMHVSHERVSSLREIVPKLLEDIAVKSEQSNTEIRFVMLSGDLVHNGSQFDELLEEALNVVLIPVVRFLGLSLDDVFIVSGNHEVDTQGINREEERELGELLVSSEDIDRYCMEMTSKELSRLSSFYRCLPLFSGKPDGGNLLYRSFIREVNGLRFGIACMDSNWRYNGDSHVANMIIGKRQMQDACIELADTDIRICMFHHPVEWLVKADRADIRKLIGNFDIVLNGHVHASNSAVAFGFLGQTVFDTCGKLDISNNMQCGYSIISIDPESLECCVELREYFGSPRNAFDSAVNLLEGGQYVASLRRNRTVSEYTDVLFTALKAGYEQYISRYFIRKLIDGLHPIHYSDGRITKIWRATDSARKKNDEEIRRNVAVMNVYEDDEDSLMLLNDILLKLENPVLFYGEAGSGKSTLLHYFGKYLLDHYEAVRKIPVIVDCHEMHRTGKSLQETITAFMAEVTDGKIHIRSEIAEMLLTDGRLVVLFDNIHREESGKLALQDLMDSWPNNKFTFTVTGRREEVRELLGISAGHVIRVYINEVLKQRLIDEVVRTER